MYPNPPSSITQPDTCPKLTLNIDPDEDDETEEPLVTDALIGKQEKDRSNNVDVKIGDGMDIAIHGENGQIFLRLKLRLHSRMAVAKTHAIATVQIYYGERTYAPLAA